MAPLQILISGAGIAGTSAAFWLSRLGHEVTVIERAPELRTNGLQIDLRGAGIEVLRRMGLEEVFRENAVAEQGLRLVDERGRSWGFFPANRSGKGLQSFTTDFEIMRGDLCKLLVDACQKKVRFVFGVQIVKIEEKNNGGLAEVMLSDGQVQQYDIVIGADGLGSKTRRILFGVHGENSNPGYHSIGAFAAYGTIPRQISEAEGYNATSFIATKNRGIMTRRHNPQKLQVYAMCDPRSSAVLASSTRSDLEEEKKALVEIFCDAGWQSKEIIHALTQSEDLYCERMGVVKLDTWSRGRVVLLGDAGYCPSAMTGMGTTSAMVGAYILAGEVDKYCGNVSSEAATTADIMAAFKAYEKHFRPFMEQVQRGLTDTDHYMEKFPSSRFGIRCLYFLFWIASMLRLDILAQLVLRESIKDWKLPQFPDMDKL